MVVTSFLLPVCIRGVLVLLKYLNEWRLLACELSPETCVYLPVTSPWLSVSRTIEHHSINSLVLSSPPVSSLAVQSSLTRIRRTIFSGNNSYFANLTCSKSIWRRSSQDELGWLVKSLLAMSGGQRRREGRERESRPGYRTQREIQLCNIILTILSQFYTSHLGNILRGNPPTFQVI